MLPLIFYLMFISLSSTYVHRPLFCRKFINQSHHDSHAVTSHGTETHAPVQHATESFDKLRDLIWTMTAATRQQLSLRLPIELKVKPSEDALLNSAFNDTRSLDKLKALQAGWSKKEAVAVRMIEAEVGRLIAAGRLLPPSKKWNQPDFKACFMGRLNPHIYEGTPLVSFLLQYFKRPSSIHPIVDRVSFCHRPDNGLPVELLVNVDSPEDALTWVSIANNWTLSARGMEVTPVFHDNIHEIRSYNRLASLARGRVLVTLQDDNLLPLNCSWLPDVLRLMEEHKPRLAAIGLSGFTYGPFQDMYHDNNFISFLDKGTGLPFHFVMNVDFGPLVLSRRAFLDIGGLDEATSDRGECGITSDWELSYRLWAAGYHVGYKRLLGKERAGVGFGGTHLPGRQEHRCWHWGLYNGGITQNSRFYGDLFLNETMGEIIRLNHDLLTPVFTRCPYNENVSGGCTSWEKDGYRYQFTSTGRNMTNHNHTLQ